MVTGFFLVVKPGDSEFGGDAEGTLATGCKGGGRGREDRVSNTITHQSHRSAYVTILQPTYRRTYLPTDLPIYLSTNAYLPTYLPLVIPRPG